MSLQVGIIGMPNVGKSTLLNALTHTHAEASNYPFCTIEKNVGVTAIDDPRLQQLADRLHPEEVVPATIQFVDIAGLVRGASKGEGLGNRFLGHVREADALVHVVRSFENEEIVHVDGRIDPVRDLEIVQTELLLADLETVERHEEKLRKQAKGNPKEVEEALGHLAEIAAPLKRGKAPSSLPPPALLLARELLLLTLKPTLIILNLDEGHAGESDPRVEALSAAAGTDVEPMAIRLEEELSRLDPEERASLRRELGLPADPLHDLVERSRRLLGLITFYTIANDKLRAWLVPAGTTARKAAGKIHTDMERGFIRAEVFSPGDLLTHGSRAELHKHGLIRVEGREYHMRDGDVVQILFQG